MSRECRKCGEIIPYNVIINGKKHSLLNRKFCLKCSPHKCHNTSPNDPIKRKGRKWKDFSLARKEDSKICNYYRSLRLREELYDRLGGKCKVCGYNKCKRALSFHHRDPSKKLFCMSLNILWSKNKNLLEKEVDKCDLLCLNCHAELEDKISKEKETNIVNKVNKKYGTHF